MGPFNFFLFPLLSELGGYPTGFDKSNSLFITPMEMDRKKWRSLKGINLFYGQTYQIAMSPTEEQDKVIPNSFRIILNQHPKKPEGKSLAPDGNPCTGITQGMLGRTKIVAGELIAIGKETARRWDMINSTVHLYKTSRKMCVAEPRDRKRWSEMSVTQLIRDSGLSPTTMYKILEGEEVRCQILSGFVQTIDKGTIKY